MSATPKFAIGFCHTGSVRTEFMLSVVAAANHPSAVRLIHAGGPYIHINRNNVVRDFLAFDDDAEWLLSVDTDIEFTPTDIDVLLAAGDVHHRILAGLYFTWILGCFVPCWFTSLQPMAIAANPDAAPIQPLASCGMGFTAIHRSVLQVMYRADEPSPWYGHDRLSTPMGDVPAAEDATFCMRAAMLGFRTWGVATVALNHYKTSAENRATYAMRQR